MRRLMFLTTASAILALSAGNSLARAAEGEHGPPRTGGREEGHVDPHSVVHGDHRGVVRVPPKEIPHEGGVSVFGGKEHRPDEWRYRYENGAWWYWQPNKHWTYYDNGGWQDYAVESPAPVVVVPTVPVAPAPVVTLPVPSDPNFYWHNNQWWYWNADKHWTYYDHGHWHDGAPGMGPKRREEEHREIRKDEHERHEEHEGPRK